MSKASAYITGASSGIGKEYARQLAPDYDLTLIARSEDKLNSLAESLKNSGSEIAIIKADLTNDKDLKKVSSKISQDNNVGLLVNNAGYGTTGLFANSNLEKERNQIQLNVLALVELTHAALQGFKASRAAEKSIINVSSIAGFMPAPLNSNYGATKAYVTNFSEGLSEEVKEDGINIQVLCPGFTRTDFQDNAGFDKSKIPDFFWMESSEVVTESIKALQKKQVVVVPGLMNKSTAAIVELIPRDLTRMLSGLLLKLQ